MLKINIKGKVKERQLLLINQDKLNNNASKEKVRQLFLKDVQNKFVVNRKQQLLKRISYKLYLQQEWFQEDRGEQDHLYQAEAVMEYQQKVKQFQEKLLLIIHLVKGQLAQATELLGIRHSNTKQGGLHNIFINYRIIAFVTMYYKNYQQTRKMKIIY